MSISLKKQKSEKRESQSMARKLVKVSALAVAAMKCQVSTAMAQTVKITCKQPINIGNLVACSPGSYVIAPDGGHSVKGCLIINTTAIAGVCKVSTLAGPITKNVIVKATKSAFVMTQPTGTGSLSMTNIKLQRRGSVTTDLTLVYTPGELSKTMTFDVGATLRYADKQTFGSYTGSVVITAEIAP